MTIVATTFMYPS